MRVDPNFCLFVEVNEVKWSFGDPDDEFLTFVVNFLTGLGQIGQEIFGHHGIASIEFEQRIRSGFQSSEVFIVSLMNKFFLIMSTPHVTMKLIESQGGIPHDVQEIMSAVLVGQAAMLYSECISEVEEQETRAYLESLWQNIIINISDKYQEVMDKIVSGDSSNFSMLSFIDLLFLHYFIRKQPELIQPLSPQGWALVSHSSGGEIPLDFHIERRDPVVLAGYLGIIISFIKTLFDSTPKALIFGTNTIQRLSFINGENEYFLAVDSPISELMQDEEFRNRFLEMDNIVHTDLEKPIKKRIIEEIIEFQTKELEELSFKTLLENYVLSDIGKYFPQKKLERRRLLSRIFGRS